MGDRGSCRHGSNMATDGVAGPATDPDTSPSQTGCLGVESTSARGGSRPRSGVRLNPDSRSSPGARHEARCGPGSGEAVSGSPERLPDAQRPSGGRLRHRRTLGVGGVRTDSRRRGWGAPEAGAATSPLPDSSAAAAAGTEPTTGREAAGQSRA